MAGSARVRVRYRPANTVADLDKRVRATGRKSMAEFLMDDRVQDVADAAAVEIAAAAKALVDKDGGELSRSIEPAVQEPQVYDGNPRRVASVIAHGGIYPNARDPESSIAAVRQFGNSRVEGDRFLSKAGQPYHTPKRTT